MAFSSVSLLAVAVIVAALGVAWSRRFLASAALIIANVVVFVLTLLGPVRHGVLGAVDGPSAIAPIAAIHGELGLYTPNLVALRPIGALQLVTNLFVHEGLLHIFGNMVMLFAFGMPFEERIGHRRFLAIYLAAGLAGSLVETFLQVDSATLMMGASGAVFGIMGAFAARYPNQVVGVPLPLLFFLIRIPMRVIVGALLYVAYQLFYVLYLATSPESSLSHIAYGAHFGGLAMGILLALTVLPKAGHERSGGPGSVAVDLGAFTPFARDSQTQKVLAQMRVNNDEPAVFQAWLDRFFRTATCPTCSHRVMPRHGGQIVCTQGHKFDVRKGNAPSATPVSSS
ncbi:MAG TPA: rhomboid family intramembrane serine protease [Candidatus Thermoplasmatota archaeon]|nr:rhomboid family intramembrane serine protease [Candidatus Thermoplasmatota archaeon]